MIRIIIPQRKRSLVSTYAVPQDEDLVAIAEGRADYLEEPKLVEVTEEEEEEESLKVERGPDVEEAVTDITRGREMKYCLLSLTL